MRLHRKSKLLIEPPSGATGDIAFNLIVFFLVCASVQPDSGRRQEIPRSEENQEQKAESENVEVGLTGNTGIVIVSGDTIRTPDFAAAITAKLRGKNRPEDRVVIVKSKTDTPYFHWISVTTTIEQAGGLVTIEREEELAVLR